MRVLTLVPLLAAGLLQAQAPDVPQTDVDIAIQSATAAKNPATLEKEAAKFESLRLYDTAEKLLSAALTLRGQISGDQSADYGLCLLKLGDVEHKRIRPKEAAAYYSRAVRLLPGRPEAANAFLYLGIAALGTKQYTQSAESLHRAHTLDVSLEGPALMWMALMSERQDKPEEAEAQYKSALAAENPESVETIESLTLYGRFLQQHGRDEEAQAMKARASAIHLARPVIHMPHTSPAPKPADTPGVYRVGGGVTSPAVIRKVDPSYTEEARVARISGTVLLQIVVGVDGQADNIRVVKGIAFGLDDSAIATIAKWVFRPGEKYGVPVPVYATVEVNFRLL